MLGMMRRIIGVEEVEVERRTLFVLYSRQLVYATRLAETTISLAASQELPRPSPKLGRVLPFGRAVGSDPSTTRSQLVRSSSNPQQEERKDASSKD